MTPQMKKVVRTMFRQHPLPCYDALAQRAALKARIDASTENGKIAICRAGMDCDCTQYSRVSHVAAPVGVFAFELAEAKHEEWLDGPETTTIGKPSENPIHHKSRDRALEAYEDGHPSTVYWGSLDD